MQSGSETCFQCEKRVYPLDRLSTGDRVYHKSCFRCNECNRTLSATNFAKLEGIILCKPHYIEKFRRRGE
ncbi:LIM domain and actin-binding protein 1 [Cichlidogyrus casuarinus]|uniref:LIM domain and actin-binding protein 1 n=1 Tax=Cichlidogyrus casuarinus TaxID=1844966 RepID=A0ABD2QNW2_9PLAT